MNSPNIWVGIGDYGEAFLKRASERYETLKLLSSDTALGAPILCHVDVGEEIKREASHGIAYLGAIDGANNKVLKIVEQKLHAGVRRGNNRGRAFLFLFAHVDDLLNVPGLDRPSHWLWKLLSTMSFTPSYVASIIATEPDLEKVVPGEGRHEESSFLTQVSHALHESGRTQDGDHTLTLLSPACAKSAFAEDEPPSPSIDAMTTLFDLVCSSDCDPNDSTALRTLLLQDRAEANWQPSCASFAVEAWGVNLQDMVHDVHEDISSKIVRSIDNASDNGASNLPALPEFDVPYPASKEREETQRLQFPFTHDALEDPEAALRRLSGASTKLREDLRKYWTSEPNRDAFDAHDSRVETGRRLTASIKWLYGLLDQLWVSKANSANEISDKLSKVRSDAAANALSSESTRNEASDLGSLERSTYWRDLQQSLVSLRSAVQKRPSFMPVVLTMGLVLLAGVTLAWGVLDFVNDRTSTPEFIDDPLLRLAIIVGVIVVLSFEPAMRWVILPSRYVRQGIERVRETAGRARGAVDAARKSFSERAGEMLRRDLRQRFQTEVKKQEDLFEAQAVFSRELEEQGRSLVSLELARGHEQYPSLWEKLELRAREDYLDELGESNPGLQNGTEGLKDLFREKFAPTSIEHLIGEVDEGRIEFKPTQIGAALDEFIADELLRPLLETNLIDSTAFEACQPESHVLADTGVIVGRKTELTEVFCHPNDADRIKPHLDQQQLRPVLRRGDKVFAMTVATSLSIESQLS